MRDGSLSRRRMARDDNGEDERAIRNPEVERRSPPHSTFCHHTARLSAPRDTDTTLERRQAAPASWQVRCASNTSSMSKLLADLRCDAGVQRDDMLASNRRNFVPSPLRWFSLRAGRCFLASGFWEHAGFLLFSYARATLVGGPLLQC